MSCFVWAEIPCGSSLDTLRGLSVPSRLLWVGRVGLRVCEAGENPGTRGMTGAVPSGFPLLRKSSKLSGVSGYWLFVSKRRMGN